MKGAKRKGGGKEERREGGGKVKEKEEERERGKVERERERTGGWLLSLLFWPACTLSLSVVIDWQKSAQATRTTAAKVVNRRERERGGGGGGRERERDGERERSRTIMMMMMMMAMMTIVVDADSTCHRHCLGGAAGPACRGGSSTQPLRG